MTQKEKNKAVTMLQLSTDKFFPCFCANISEFLDVRRILKHFG